MLKLEVVKSLAAAAVLAYAAVPAVAEDTIKMAVVPYMSQGIISIGIAEGYFEAEGITVEQIKTRDPSPITPGLMAGDIDLALTIPSAGYYNAIAKGGGARIVGPGVTFSPDACDYGVIYGRKGMARADIAAAGPQTLKVAASPKTFMEYAMRLTAGMPGFEGTTMDLARMRPTSLVDAMSNNAVDIALTAEPWVSRLNDSGAGQVIVGLSEVLPNAQFTFLVFSERLLKDEPQLGIRAKRAMDAAIARYNEGKTPRNVEILAEFTGLDPELVEKSCWAHVPMDGRIDQSAIMGFQAWLLEQKLVDQVLPADQVMAIVPAQ